MEASKANTTMSNNDKNNTDLVSQLLEKSSLEAIRATMTSTSVSNSTATNTNPILQMAPLPSDSTVTSNPHIPSVSASAVLGESESMPEGTPICRGHDFQLNSNSNSPPNSSSSSDILDSILQSMQTTGFQATNLAMAIQQINELRSWRLSSIPHDPKTDDPDLACPTIRSKIRARIFFGYTSNQISSGQREVIKFLVQHKMVDVLITTAGGIEEDIIKCFKPTYLGDFRLPGRELRKRGLNRIGNLILPNNNYCEFEDWMTPLLHRMHDEQDEKDREWARAVTASSSSSLQDLPERFVWTPSTFIERLGREIDHPDSVLYWAAKNSIPVFCPALTDGSVGDMLHFHSYKRSGFVLDIAKDVRRINDLAVRSHCTGQIILGAGLVKHHTCNANLMRNGADYSVFVNTSHEYDGSDAGASPDEAISWGKIRSSARPVKVCADATIVWPLIVSQTFAKDVEGWKERTKDCVCWVDDIDRDEDDQ